MIDPGKATRLLDIERIKSAKDTTAALISDKLDEMKDTGSAFMQDSGIIKAPEVFLRLL